MNTRISTLSLFAILVSVTLTTTALAAAPLGTSVTYQGQLKQDGVPANGNLDMQFRLFDAATLGNQVGNPVTVNGVAVPNGLFTVTLNADGQFGPSAFNGEQRWLQITVDGTTLTPRQALTAAPYAATALSIVGLDGHSLDAADGDPADAVFVDADGNVGIGTTSPDTRLDVVGNGRVETLHITGGVPLGQIAGEVLGWGTNIDGQITVPAGEFTAVAAGGRHSLAIRSDGTLAGWGRNIDGEINVPSGTFIAVSAGGAHSVAIRSDGTLAGWGANAFGVSTPPAGTFIAVAAGSGHNIGIRSDGTLVGWGNNTAGQTTVPTGTFVAVSAGNVHSIGLRTNGTLVGWGSNTSGQINVPAGTFAAIDAGALHNLAMRSDGTLVGWGSNVSGEASPPGGTFSAFSAGAAHSLGIRTDGTLAGWGFNADGQINVPTGFYFNAIAAGSGFSLAIEVDPASINFGLLLAQDSAAKPGTNTWTIFSDRRLKRNITPLTGALEKLLSLQGVCFEWNDRVAAGGHTGTQMGLIADEVQRAFPQWVGRDPKGYQTLTVGGFEALTAEALRELRAEKDCQLAEKDREIEELRSEMAKLRERIDASAVQNGPR